jgi:hypothetical protein
LILNVDISSHSKVKGFIPETDDRNKLSPFQSKPMAEQGNPALHARPETIEIQVKLYVPISGKLTMVFGQRPLRKLLQQHIGLRYRHRPGEQESL